MFWHCCLGPTRNAVLRSVTRNTWSAERNGAVKDSWCDAPGVELAIFTPERVEEG
jgi:hypothetical protein